MNHLLATWLPSGLDDLGKVIGYIVALGIIVAGLRRSKVARSIGRALIRAWTGAFGHPVQGWLTRSIQPQLDQQTADVSAKLAAVQASNDLQHADVAARITSLEGTTGSRLDAVEQRLVDVEKKLP